MAIPCIITVAITGSVPQKSDNPAVPITINEQIESTHAAFEAGATIAHLHVRKDDGAPSSDADRFAALQEGLRRHCPGIIVQFSTGGRSGKGSERGGMLVHRPDMASLSTGSCNFPSIIYENHPDLIRELACKMREYDVKPEIEVFDLSMLYQALRLVDEGILKKPLHVQFVFNVKNAMPAIREVLEFEVTQLKKLMPEATWTAAGIGRHQYEVNRWCLWAVTAVPAWRTMSGLTATTLRPRMRLWCDACLRFAPNSAVNPPRSQKLAACCRFPFKHLCNAPYDSWLGGRGVERHA
jgi:3-keto-5-aminohexanoate cleavage enzyme